MLLMQILAHQDLAKVATAELEVAREELLALETQASTQEENFGASFSSPPSVSIDACTSSTEDSDALPSEIPIKDMKASVVASSPAAAETGKTEVSEIQPGTQPIKYSAQFATPPEHELEKAISNCRGLQILNQLDI